MNAPEKSPRAHPRHPLPRGKLPLEFVVRELVHDRLMDAAMEYANLLAQNPDRQMGWIKELITKNGANPDYNEVMRLEHGRINECYSTPEHREAVTAFQEKRPAKFR